MAHFKVTSDAAITEAILIYLGKQPKTAKEILIKIILISDNDLMIKLPQIKAVLTGMVNDNLIDAIEIINEYGRKEIAYSLTR